MSTGDMRSRPLRSVLNEEFTEVKRALRKAAKITDTDEVIDWINDDAEDAAVLIARLDELEKFEVMDSRGFIKGCAFALDMTVQELLDQEDLL